MVSPNGRTGSGISQWFYVHRNNADHLPTLENDDFYGVVLKQIHEKERKRAAKMLMEWVIPIQDGGIVILERDEIAARIMAGD